MDNLELELKSIQKKIEDNTLLLSKETDSEMKALIEEDIKHLKSESNNLQKTIDSINGVYSTPEEDEGDPNIDVNPNVAILEIRAGTGGEEASLFAKDLFRMYERYAEKVKWHFEEQFMSESETGGIKTAVAEVRGTEAYKLLKNESGVHRVQRVPSTEAAGRIHTSAATIAVLPKVKKINIEIKPEDLGWEFYRAGGKGGQNVNKVSTAVRLTHIPTQTVIECQEERSQGKNRDKALGILTSKLYTLMQEQQVKSITDLRTAQVGGGDRNEKIRTYNFPQDRITDHRLNKNYHNINGVMDGSIEKILVDCSELS
jgi:peptide chain release factor 1